MQQTLDSQASASFMRSCKLLVLLHVVKWGQTVKVLQYIWQTHICRVHTLQYCDPVWHRKLKCSYIGFHWK